MSNIKNIILFLHAVVITLTLTMVLLPNLWIIKAVGDANGVKGMVIPTIWMVYVATVFVASGLTFSWLIKK